jgi:hypothetical protein
VSLQRPKPGIVLPPLLAIPLSLIFATRVWCNDIWWHLATGRWIVENRAVPNVDPFTFGGGGAPWKYVTVLSDLLYYAVYSMGGAPGLVLLKVLIAFILLTLLGWALRSAGASVTVLAAVLLLIAVLVQPRMSMARPLALGGLALAASLAIVLLVWEHKAPLVAFALVPLAALWSGLHASAVLIVAVAGALVVAWVIAGQKRSCALVLLVNLALVAGVLALLPTGRGAFHSAFDHSTAGCMRGFIQEWGTVDWRRGSVWVPYVLMIGALPWLARNWRNHALHLCLALGGLALPILGGRLAPMAALLLAPALAAGLTTALAGLPQRTAALSLVGLALVATVALAISPGIALDRTFGLGLHPGRYPLETVATLKKLPDGRILNDFGLGGYLIWEGYEGRVFMDGRTVVVFDEQHCQDLLVPLYLEQDGPDRIADRFDIPYGLAEWDSSLYERFTRSTQWVPVHHGIRSSLFVRRQHLDRLPVKVIPQPDLRQLADPDWMAQWYAPVVKDPARLEELEIAIVWTARHSPYSPVWARVLQFLEANYPETAEPIKVKVRAALEDVL